MNVQAMAGMAPAFNIRWDATRAAYFVDKPNIGDTAVYTAEQVAALQQQLAAAREALKALVTMWRDASEAWRDKGTEYGEASAITYSDCADDLAATLQRDRQP